MRHRRHYEGRTSATPFGRYTQHCNKHNTTFPTHEFCRECERERYLAKPEPPPKAEPTAAEKERLARIRSMADAMAGSE